MLGKSAKGLLMWFFLAGYFITAMAFTSILVVAVLVIGLFETLIKGV